MEKRYQVFVSSTFLDLVEERQAVQRSILELGHMPAGMELFPASDDAAWALIKDVIDQSDYYVVIVGGRYGSTDSDGVGFTEAEYAYAVENRKPVLPLLHRDPEKLPRERTETDSTVWGKLEAFRATLEAKHTCDYWSTVEDLRAKVIISLTVAAKRHPAAGWVRADEVPADATVSEILMLRNRIQELETERGRERTQPPPSAEGLAQGDAEVTLSVEFVSLAEGAIHWRGFSAEARTTWDELFASVAPVLIYEGIDEALREKVSDHLWPLALRDLRQSNEEWAKGRTFRDQTVSDESYSTCIVQLRALGLVQESRRSRSVKDTSTYWTLTPYGDYRMTQLRAIRRERDELNPIDSDSNADA